MTHPRYQLLATVVSHERIIGSEFEIVLFAPEIAHSARPGQFVEILFGENFTPLIRRPFSIYRIDRERETFSIFYVARGSFTSGLAQKQPGDTLSLLAPLGSPFRWEENTDRRPLLLAGGIGAPPITFLASELSRFYRSIGRSAQEIIVINAARNRDLLVGIMEFEALGVQLTVVTEDGSQGHTGLVTEVLNSLLENEGENFQLYACGPMPMLKAIGSIAIVRSLPCQVSVETAMPCGIGICYGCAIAVHAPTGSTYARACYDGPVFEAKQLDWGE